MTTTEIGESADIHLRENAPDLILLDRPLPDASENFATIDVIGQAPGAFR